MKKILLIVAASVSLFAWNAETKADAYKSFMDQCVTATSAKYKPVCDCLAKKVPSYFNLEQYEALEMSLAKNVVPLSFLKFVTTYEQECAK